VRVLITGSRNWEGRWAERELGLILDTLELLADFLNSPLIIVHGDCPTGADALADRWARSRDYEPEIHPANWVTGGKGAGLFRNSHMVNLGADMCIGFLRDSSKGTTDCLTKAKAAGIPTFVVHWN